MRHLVIKELRNLYLGAGNCHVRFLKFCSTTRGCEIPAAAVAAQAHHAHSTFFSKINTFATRTLMTIPWLAFRYTMHSYSSSKILLSQRLNQQRMTQDEPAQLSKNINCLSVHCLDISVNHHMGPQMISTTVCASLMTLCYDGKPADTARI